MLLLFLLLCWNLLQERNPMQIKLRIRIKLIKTFYILSRVNILVTDFGKLTVDQLQVLVNLALVLLIDLGKGKCWNVSQDDQCQAIKPSSNVGESPEDEKVLQWAKKVS